MSFKTAPSTFVGVPPPVRSETTAVKRRATGKGKATENAESRETTLAVLQEEIARARARMHAIEMAIRGMEEEEERLLDDM
jgi:hypothetical protein